MKPTGCIRCGTQASHVLHPLELVACDSCTHAWLDEESLSTDSILSAVGEFDPKRVKYDKHCAAFDAELLKRTLEWAKKAREAA